MATSNFYKMCEKADPSHDLGPLFMFLQVVFPPNDMGEELRGYRKVVRVEEERKPKRRNE